MKKRWLIGTRGSPLALAQAWEMQHALEKHWQGRFEFELKIIRTNGDRLQQASLVDEAKLEKGLFTKELEEEMQCDRIDCAIHSCKDLPVDLDPAFKLAAIPKRSSAHDFLIVKKSLSSGKLSDKQLAPGSIVWTGSPRRKLQWLGLQPHTGVEPVRGNIDTRLSKLRQSSTATAILLAEAGFERLKPSLEGFDVYRLSMEEMLPAPGQGALAVECRSDDLDALEIFKPLNDSCSEYQIRAEREFLRLMGGGCLAPLAAYAEPIENNNFCLHGIYFDSNLCRRRSIVGSQAQPEELARQLVQEFRV